MNIGVLTDGFVQLSGAFDFINNLILALSFKANKNNDNIYVFINIGKSYKKYRGIKRFISKICYLVRLNGDCKIVDCYAKFKKYNNVKYVLVYKNFKEVVQKFNLACIFPKLDFKQDTASIPVIRYLYDCQHKYYPEFFSKEELEERDKYFTAMIKDPCIVNSKDTKNDLIKFFNADKEKIFDLPFTPKLKEEYLKDNSRLIKKYNLPKRYFLSSNQFWIHKDHPTLFKAFSILSKIPEFQDVELLCTGVMNDYRRPEYIIGLNNLIKELGIERKIQLLGLIPKTEQIEIMKTACAVVQTTLFEGGAGGGCVWDACALGVRSIVSDIPVNLEIQNNLVTFFETKNEHDLVQKMKMILRAQVPRFSNEDLLKRNTANIEQLGNRLYEIINRVCS